MGDFYDGEGPTDKTSPYFKLDEVLAGVRGDHRLRDIAKDGRLVALFNGDK